MNVIDIKTKKPIVQKAEYSVDLSGKSKIEILERMTLFIEDKKALDAKGIDLDLQMLTEGLSIVIQVEAIAETELLKHTMYHYKDMLNQELSKYKQKG